MRKTVVTLALWGLCLAACGDRTVITESHGRAFRESFSRQAVNPQGGKRPMTMGLDSQEASIVADTYRQNLAPKGGGQVQEQPILLMSPHRASGAAEIPPSVPPGR